MITLVKIRTLYLKRNKIKFIANYLFIPIILFLITFLSNSSKFDSTMTELEIKANYSFEFQGIKEIDNSTKRNYLRILTNNKTLGEKFVNCSKKYTNFSKYYEIYEDYSILLKQNIKENEEPIIEIKQEKNEVISFRIKDDYFNIRDLEEINSQLKIPTSSDSFMPQMLIYYQLIYNFLLEENSLNSTKKISGIIKSTISNNRIDKTTISYYLAPLFIIFIYSVLFLDFCFRMIYEKQGKLDKFLNRQGIKKFNFFFSWFLTYIFLSSFTTIIILYFLIKLIFELPNYSLLIIF